MGNRAITDTDVLEICEKLAVDRHSVYRRALGLPLRGRRSQLVDRELAARGILSVALLAPANDTDSAGA